MNRLNKFKKEDGSLDVKQIAELPFEERMKIIDDLTDEQYHQYTEYLYSMPINKELQHVIPVVVDYSMEDEIKRGTAVDFDELLKRLRKEIGLE